MSRDEFDARMLLIFSLFEENPEDSSNGRIAYARYPGIHAYDMVVNVQPNNIVLIRYDLDPPNRDMWEHQETMHSFDEAWKFIRNFLQEHP